jgi:hypothetical protein
MEALMSRKKLLLQLSGWIALLFILWTNPAHAQGCPYGSVQARVQPNETVHWSPTLTVQVGQAFRVGSFMNNSGQFVDCPSCAPITVTAPGGGTFSAANGSYVTASLAGTYRVVVNCGPLSDTATVTSVGPPQTPSFSNLSASLGASQAQFSFSYSGSTSGYHVDLSTVSGMTTDVYVDFATGSGSPVSTGNPQRWDKYRCGKTLYWRVWNQERTVSSPIQTATTFACGPAGFSGLSSNLGASLAQFSFSYSGSTSGYHVDLSTVPGMTTDVYVDFATGSASPVSTGNPQRWDKYRCGKTLYWRVWNQERTVSSAIQTATTFACGPAGFSGLSSNLGANQARFSFSYSGSTSGYHVDLSTVSGMTTDVYVDFATGSGSPVSTSNPRRWDKYRCGKTLYWRVWNQERTISSPIQSAQTFVCDNQAVADEVWRGEWSHYWGLSNDDKDAVSNLLNGTVWESVPAGGPTFTDMRGIDPQLAANQVASGGVRTLYVNGSREQVRASVEDAVVLANAVGERLFMVYSPILDKTDYFYGDTVIQPKIVLPKLRIVNLVSAAVNNGRNINVFSFSMGGTITAIALDSLTAPAFADRVRHFAFAPGICGFGCSWPPVHQDVYITRNQALEALNTTVIPTKIVVHPADATRGGNFGDFAFGHEYALYCSGGSVWCQQNPGECLQRVWDCQFTEYPSQYGNRCWVQFVDNLGDPGRLWHDLPAYASLINPTPTGIEIRTCP